MKAYSRSLKSVEDLNAFVKDFAELPRIIFLTDKDHLSPYYKAITANFRYRIAFAHVFSNATSLIERL
jgi:Tfp pilus assembly protein PilO